MLIIALVLAVISLAALVTAVVTSNELIAWVCIGFSALGVLLLVIDAVRDRNRRATAAPSLDAGERTEVIPPVLGDEAEFDEAGYDEAGYDEEALHADELGEADRGDEADRGVADYDDEAADHEAEADDEAADRGDEADDDEADFPELTAELAVEDHPDEVVSDDPDHDLPSDDEPVYPVAAEEAAIHTVTDEYLAAQDDPEPEIESYVADAEPGRTPEQPGESDTVIDSDDTSYTVLEPPTVSPAADSASDAAIVTTPDETDVTGSEESEERDGER